VSGLAIVVVPLATGILMFAINRPHLGVVALIMLTALPLTRADHGRGVRTAAVHH
jgi:hypothetical protein